MPQNSGGAVGYIHGVKIIDTVMARSIHADAVRTHPLAAWVIVFIACIVWAVGYWIVYPAWPGITGYTHGLFDHSQRDEVTANVAALKAARAAREQALSQATLAQIQSDPQLDEWWSTRAVTDSAQQTASMVEHDRGDVTAEVRLEFRR